MDPQFLVSVGLVPEALLEYNSPRDKVTHEVAVTAVYDHGLLTLTPEDMEALKAAIAKLVGRPQTSWAAIVEALQLLRRVDRESLPISIRSFVDTQAGDSGSANIVRLAVVEDAAVPVADNSESAPNQTELVSLIDVASSSAFRGARSLVSFPSGTPRQQIAEAVLIPLAARSTEIVAFDPFLFDDLVGANRASDARDHVEWLCQLLGDVLPPDSTMRLVANLPSPTRAGQPLDPEQIKQKISATLAAALRHRRSGVSVEVTLFQGTRPGIKASNRYLFFSCGAEFEVSHDLLRLGSQTIPAPDDFSLRRLDRDQLKRARAVVDGYRKYPERKALIQWVETFPK